MASKRRQSGFTLVEVMVAMMIVALALPALLQQAESLSQHTFSARTKTQAFWVAQNKMTELNVDYRLRGELPPRKDSHTVELGGTKWKWLVTTEETLFPGILRVNVSVSRDGEQSQQASLSGFIQGELL